MLSQQIRYIGALLDVVESDNPASWDCICMLLCFIDRGFINSSNGFSTSYLIDIPSETLL